MARVRTAKQRSQRIELTYFKRTHPLRRWRSVLSLVSIAAVLVWVAAMAVTGQRSALMSGPVAPAHAAFATQCESCHTPATGRGLQMLGFRQHATDQACIACHDAPLHSTNQLVTPACGSCHVEHVASARLAAVPDMKCTACHVDLKVRDGTPTVAASVDGFTSHPEFVVKRTSTPDPSALQFNHAVHVGEGLQLECSTCHVPESSSAGAGSGGSSRRGPGTGLMMPLTFENQCASCHPLDFDELVSEPAPHAAPREVRRAVRAILSEYAAQNPEAVRNVAARRDARPSSPVPARTAEAWIAERAADAESRLWGTTCALCHVVTRRGNDLPEIKEPRIPARWLTRARFDHAPHRGVACVGCHANAPASTLTADVLLPGIGTCQPCHRPQGEARASCDGCHAYHDWTKEKPVPIK